ncbi:MAG: nitrous oxide reductase accessory protein NosL [Campylobacterota bacterium]|nr:nitrous oxide reductase accessory protein NosL [Campylobacterota bacterium]
MKKVLLTLLAIGAMISYANAEVAETQKPKKMMKMFQMVPADKATILQEGKAKMFCPECGMTLPMFYKTNHAATVDGKVKQYCSIHCIVEDTKKGSKLSNIKVVDVKSLKFIDANKAFYVVGSDKKGTMTMVSKYAFASKVNADAFAKENGGKVVDYQGAYKAAEGDFDKDSAMVAKKQGMMTKKGEMIYGKMCQKTDKKFATTAEAKAFMAESKLCKELNPKQQQAVGLYLKNR